MTQPFSLTADSISPAIGMYAYMPNKPQLHNVVVGGNASVTAGTFVKLDATSTNTVCPVVVPATATDKPFGVVAYDIRTNSNAVGSKIAVAQSGDIVYLPCAGAVSVGAKLQFAPATGKVDDTTTAGNAYIGVAVTKGSADGDLIQVELNFDLA